MRRSAEYFVFLALALLLHLAAFVLYDRPEAPDGEGSSGGPVAVASASDEVAALIAAWEEAPRTSAAPPQATAPDADRGPKAAAAAPKPSRPEEAPEAPPPETAPPTPPPTPIDAEVAEVPVLAPSMLGSLPLPEERSDIAEQSERDVERAEAVSLPEQPGELAALSEIPAREPAPAAEVGAAPQLSPAPATRPRIETARSSPPADQPVQQEKAQRPTAEVPSSGAEAPPTASAAEAAERRSSGDDAALEAFINSAGEQRAAPSAPAPAGPSPSQLASLQQSFGAAVRAAIERRKTYPRRARARRIEGVATLRVTVSRQGRLLNASLARSSGQGQLDQAALDAARSVAKYPAAPAELAGNSFSFVVPMAFRLR